ncbi:glutamyl-tRNA(Gln) amidotransferase subunit C, mitochondrial-like [Chrysoperla carnea]|uniref:glutamyl-tRNA(Gln) amidotransferase subunit C, mitochondrial-like n=1 Tax=Chrysoperla carnea TaxID=189513 RepID=UPI001D06488A|nr:glutamyl-tRNA(Gln) amidotransferase subunit C, mitochondrial-like [Chrysoperla carnea]
MISSDKALKLLKSIITKQSCKSLPNRYLCDEAPTSLWNDKKMVLKLKELSYLQFTANSECYKIFDKYIEIAKDMEKKSINDVEPLEMTMEDVPILLRDDVVSESDQKKQILKNAPISERDYFAAPRNHLSIEQMELEATQSGKEITFKEPEKERNPS